MVNSNGHTSLSNHHSHTYCQIATPRSNIECSFTFLQMILQQLKSMRMLEQKIYLTRNIFIMHTNIKVRICIIVCICICFLSTYLLVFGMQSDSYTRHYGTYLCTAEKCCIIRVMYFGRQVSTFQGLSETSTWRKEAGCSSKTKVTFYQTRWPHFPYENTFTVTIIRILQPPLWSSGQSS
jgi:hypothetical protein